MIFQGSVVFLLLLFGHSSTSDLCPFLFAVATVPSSETFHISSIDRISMIPVMRSTTSAIIPTGLNRTIFTSSESTEIVLTSQYDLDSTTVIHSIDPTTNHEQPLHEMSKQINLTGVSTEVSYACNRSCIGCVFQSTWHLFR